MVQDQHLRFLREAQAGAPLHMIGGVVTMEETTATLLQVFVHSRTGEPAASVVTRVAHAAPEPLRSFPWPERARAAAERLATELPDYAAPRSLRLEPRQPSGALKARPDITLERADALELLCTGRCTLGVQHCDIFGRMRAEEFIGRVSDGVSGLLGPVRHAVQASAGVRRMGGAVLEYRLIHLDWPRAGDHLELRSGLSGFSDKTQRMTHWLLDPESGRAWGCSEAVAVNLDLDTRKIVPIAPAAREQLAALARPELAL
jgi:acyl-CoA thioester hydrolase